MNPARASEIEHLLRDLAPRVLAALIRRCRDFAAAEDAVQEALLAAAAQWPAQGIPDHPRAWLQEVGARRLVDEIRSNTARRRRETEFAMEAGYLVPPVEIAQAEDDTLVLMFLCCHPSLTPSSAVALTLRAVGGLTTAEIARAFLVPESTMAQRISRAKQTIQDAGASFHLPAPGDLNSKLASVLHVLYLIFNEGYTASEGSQLQRTDLAAEAIRLGRLVHARRKDNPEVAGLLALMLLTDARRNARATGAGEIVPLDRQDRATWDRALIAEGVALVSGAFQLGAVGPYQIQAAIAALHDEAASTEATDWPQIAALYELLVRMTGNPMARLNQAVAVAMVQGPKQGLALLERLEQDARLRCHHRFYAVRGHLWEMAGDPARAVADFHLAAAKTASLPERNYLLAHAAGLREASANKNAAAE